MRTYAVTGELFFVSANRLAPRFNLGEAVQEVVIDLSEAHDWDASAIAVLDRIILAYRSRGVEARLEGVPDACRHLVERVAIHDKTGAMELAASH